MANTRKESDRPAQSRVASPPDPDPATVVTTNVSGDIAEIDSLSRLHPRPEHRVLYEAVAIIGQRRPRLQWILNVRHELKGFLQCFEAFTSVSSNSLTSSQRYAYD